MNVKSAVLSSMICLCAASVAHAELTTSVDVSAVTNKVFRGDTLSDRGLSLGADLKLEHSSGVYGKYELDTVNITERNANARHVLETGYTHKFSDVIARGGIRRYMWSGPNDEGRVSDMNFSEVFLGSSAYGFTTDLAKITSASYVNPSKDLYARFGYGRQVGPVFVSGGVSSTHYALTDTTKASADVGVTYQLARNVKIGATFDYVNNGEHGKSRPNQTSAFIKYDL